jgi:hypothetical protein
MRSTTTWIIVSAFALFSAGAAYAITCDECKEIQKNKQNIQLELAQKDADLNAAFKQKNFQVVGDIRNRMLELRKKMIELRMADEKCEEACKPDLVKASECRKLMDEILRVESAENAADEQKIDSLYREFQSCNKDLEKLKKSY